MSKSKKIVIIVLACVLAVTGAFAVLTTNKKFMTKITGSIDATNYDTEFSSIVRTEFRSDYPLVQTEDKNIFYEANPNGKIKYYKYSDGDFSEYQDVKTKTVSFDSSYQTVKIKLYYLKTDVGTIGYGVYDTKQESDTKLIAYAFVRLIDCPKSYDSTARTDYVILVDMDEEDAYKPDKTYSDIYSYNMKSGKTLRVVSQRDRSAQEDGTMSEGWTIFTDSSVNSMNKYDLFASSRNYDVKNDKTYDFMSVVNSRSMKKSTVATVVGSPDYNIWENDGAYYCFVNTDEEFAVVKNGDKENPLATFSGKFSDYSVINGWILNKTSTEFTDVFTGEVKSVKKATFDSLAGYIANPSGNKFVLFCGADVQSAILYDTSSGEDRIAGGAEIFNDGICNFAFIDDTSFIVTTYDENHAAINRVCTF